MIKTYLQYNGNMGVGERMNIPKKKDFIFTFIIIFVAMGISFYSVSYLNNGYVILACFLLVSVLFATILYKNFSGKGLEDIKEYIKGLEDMAFTVSKGKNIPEDIKEQLDQLVNNIKENLKTQVEISTKIFNICEKLNIVSMESLDSAEFIASSVEIADTNTVEQSHMLTDANSLANEIVRSLDNIEKDIIDKTQFISGAITTAQGSMENIGEIGERIELSKNMTKKSLDQILKLKSYSDEIVSLIDLINSISKETNMLSLNASIEAARAGEEGKGFAIVAIEVGKLAQETEKVSSKIEEVIHTLKDDISVVTEFMEEEMDYMEENWSIMKDTNVEFEDIIGRLNEGKESLEEITKVIKDNNSTVGQITENIEKVTSFSQEIASHMEETTAQVLEQHGRAKHLQEMAVDIKEYVFSMQQFVAGNIMEEMMLKEAYYIKDYLRIKEKLTQEDIEELLMKTGMDAIYITDPSGVVKYTNETSAVGLNLYEADRSFLILKEGRAEYMATPIKARVEDGKLFKFLTVVDEEKRLYEVGLSLESLLK